MALKSESNVTTNSTVTIAITGRRDTLWFGGTWDSASLEIRSYPKSGIGWYVVEETAITANNNWSPQANIPQGALIDLVFTGGGGSMDLDVIHQGG